MNNSVIITPLVLSDSEGFFRLIASERHRLTTYFPVTTSSVVDERSARRYVKDLLDKARARETFCFILRDYEGGDPAGAIYLKQFDWSVPKCEAAYFVSELYQRRGFATLGLIWAVDLAFSELGVQKVFARVDPENKGSIKVLEHCGFERDGLLRRDFKTPDGTLLDLFVYSSLR